MLRLPNISMRAQENKSTSISMNEIKRQGISVSNTMVLHVSSAVLILKKTYGAIGRNVIHVHHLKPLSEIGERYHVDPINDLRPVCPNCHVIIHKRTPSYSIDEIMAMIKNAGIE